jgi:hypothetical protein
MAEEGEKRFMHISGPIQLLIRVDLRKHDGHRGPLFVRFEKTISLPAAPNPSIPIYMHSTETDRMLGDWRSSQTGAGHDVRIRWLYDANLSVYVLEERWYQLDAYDTQKIFFESLGFKEDPEDLP